MNLASILQKKDLIYEKTDDETVILSDDKDEFHILNETATFLLDHCDGKTIKELITFLYNTCVNKDEIKYEEVKEDCIPIIEEMVNKGLITIISD
ncbi:PqqD family protein [Clostridium formicaceticum]|uniref:PqqD family protein n=1 Tax=Clostridium formicaceticum TaxID=1497 RepID=A0AAC9RU01_9CLOT|nr:PqqD family protein [Clostridium formicaceticum]AOY75345.1 hypothetical protein BJL90_05165 [Clostridium formicaceticum]ARE89795.1 hypothetical protein CLFO_42760 [Clostridium formicaceticum]